MRVMHGKTLGDDKDSIHRDGCDGLNMQIGTRKKDVRIGNNRTKSPIPHRHRVPHQRTLLASVMDDGGSRCGEIERRADADRYVERQPVRGVKAAGGRLQIERRKIGPHPVELERTRDVEWISDMLAAEDRSSASQLRNQPNFGLAADVRSGTGLRQG